MHANQKRNMTTKIKRVVALLFVAALFAINTGCNTAHGLGKDVERTGERIQDGTE
jgi:predicted small secreted protein